MDRQKDSKLASIFSNKDRPRTGAVQEVFLRRAECIIVIEAALSSREGRGNNAETDIRNCNLLTTNRLQFKTDKTKRTATTFLLNYPFSNQSSGR